MENNKFYLLINEELVVKTSGSNKEEAKYKLVKELINYDKFEEVKAISHSEVFNLFLNDSRGHLLSSGSFRKDLEQMSENQFKRHILNTIDKNARKFWNKKPHLAKEYSQLMKTNIDLIEEFLDEVEVEKFDMSDELNIDICTYALDMPMKYSDLSFEEIKTPTSNYQTLGRESILYELFAFITSMKYLETITMVKAFTKEEAKLNYALNDYIYNEKKDLIIADNFLFKFLSENDINLFNSLDKGYAHLKPKFYEFTKNVTQKDTEDFEELNTELFIDVVIDNLNKEPILGLDFEQKCKIDFFYRERDKDKANLHIMSINKMFPDVQILYEFEGKNS